MSKQSNAKIEQNYNPNPSPKICSTCTNYQSDFVERTEYGQTWTDEKNKRCGIGGFAIKKTATCDRHEFKN